MPDRSGPSPAGRGISQRACTYPWHIRLQEAQREAEDDWFMGEPSRRLHLYTGKRGDDWKSAYSYF